MHSIKSSSALWIVAQLALAAGVIWPFKAWRTDLAGAGTGFALMVGGVGLMAWTLRHNRPHNWRVAPAVRADARLIMSGPYRWIRHPMYVAVLMLTAGIVVLGHHACNAAAWIALALLFVIKSRMEEAALERVFPDYPAYRERTGGFFPRLGRTRSQG